MNRNNFTLDIIKISIALLLFMLLVVNILKIDNIEKAFIVNDRKLNLVLDLTFETARLVEKIKEFFNTCSQSCTEDVKNYLVEEKDFIVAPDETKTDGTITRYFGPDPKDLNPLTVNVPDVYDSVHHYCLLPFARRHRDDPSLWKPALAERVEITDDYKAYIIHLRKGVTWQKPSVNLTKPEYKWLKGEHYVTAQDVKFTVDLILNPAVETVGNNFQNFSSCDVIDDYTVIFKWKKKLFSNLSSTLSFTPVPKFIYGFDEHGKAFPEETLGLNFNRHWYNRKFIGCGPYEFVSYEPGAIIKLKRNEDYFGEKPAIKEINWLIYEDRLSHIRKLKNRELDLVVITPAWYREEILQGKEDSPFKNGQLNYHEFLYYSYSYIGWNMNKPLFSDKKVRQAMSYAFNGKEILESVFLGLGKLISGPFYPDSPYYDQTIKPFEFDLNRSKKLLSEAGWEDKNGDGILEKEMGGTLRKFEFTLLLFGRNPEWIATANIYRENLLKIGIKMNVQKLDRSIMQKKIDDRDFDAFTGNCTIKWEPDLYETWHSSQAMIKSSNRVGFRNEEADKIIEELMVTFDKEKQIELCHKFHKIINQEQPCTFFRSPVVIYVWQNYVKNVNFQKVRPHADSMTWYIDKN